jgi:hypothetical protein
MSGQSRGDAAAAGTGAAISTRGAASGVAVGVEVEAGIGIGGTAYSAATQLLRCDMAAALRLTCETAGMQHLIFSRSSGCVLSR